MTAQLKKTKNMKKTSIITGVRLIMANIKVIELVKDQFIMNFEQGKYIAIPQELNQNDLPLSFKYYDPILMLIKEKLSKERRYVMKMKK